MVEQWIGSPPGTEHPPEISLSLRHLHAVASTRNAHKHTSQPRNGYMYMYIRTNAGWLACDVPEPHRRDPQPPCIPPLICLPGCGQVCGERGWLLRS